MLDDDDDAPMRAEERTERLARIKARIQAAIDDPRPALSMDEVSAWIEEMIADALLKEGDEAA